MTVKHHAPARTADENLSLGMAIASRLGRDWTAVGAESHYVRITRGDGLEIFLRTNVGPATAPRYEATIQHGEHNTMVAYADGPMPVITFAAKGKTEAEIADELTRRLLTRENTDAFARTLATKAEWDQTYATTDATVAYFQGQGLKSQRRDRTSTQAKLSGTIGQTYVIAEVNIGKAHVTLQGLSPAQFEAVADLLKNHPLFA
jgi:hypothetical protein